MYVLRHGLTPDELIEQFPSLTLAQIHDALAYYYDNREEVDRDLAENTEEAVRRRYSL
jgi:uncharacterized protein (DUF433 family)